MKLKVDFITNSSSASFIILKKHLTDNQISMIHNHIRVAVMLVKGSDREIILDPWNIKEEDDRIEGETTMDNFDMLWFLEEIGVKRENIYYDHS